MTHKPAPCCIDRRGLLAAGAGSILAAMTATGARAVGPAPGEAARSPQHALEGLLEGNNRFVTEPEVCELDLAAQRARVAHGQAPWATILSCADSRVPPEIVFGGRGLGELFVARNAGNLADTATIGTLEYGAAVLGSPLIVTYGKGWAQREGGPKEEIRPGDVVWFAPGEKHWHGATTDSAMTHLAVQETLDGKAVDWLEQVSDADYGG